MQEPHDKNEVADPEALESIAAIADELDRLRALGADDDSTQYRITALYRRASRLPVPNDSALSRFLELHLLPDCIRSSKKDESRIHRMNLREILSNWLDSIPESMLWLVRPNAIRKSLELLESNRSEDALFIVSAIGYRDAAVVAALQREAEKNDDVGDTAMRLLAVIGADDDIGGWWASQIVRRLESAPPTDEFLQAMTLHGRMRTLEKLYQLSLERSNDWWIFARFGWLCDEMPGDRAEQDRVWATVLKLTEARPTGLKELINIGGVIPKCHSPAVIETLANRLEECVQATGVHRIGTLLEDVCSPAQIAKISSGELVVNVQPLRDAAVRSTGKSTPGMTVEAYDKQHAWIAGLFFGSDQIFGWVADAVDNDDNTYKQHSTMDRLAVLSVPSLPRCATTLLQNPSLAFARGGDEPSLLPFLASMRLAASMLDLKALELLVNAAGLIDGHPFRAPVDDAAELAAWLFRSEPNAVHESLLKALDKESTMAQSLATRAFRDISFMREAGTLSIEASNALHVVAKDRSRQWYVRSDAIAALTQTSLARDSAFWALLAEECKMPDGRLQYAAARALVQLGKTAQFRETVELVAFKQLEVRPLGAGKLPSDFTDDQAFLVGLLAGTEPELYAEDAAAIIGDTFLLASTETIRGISRSLPRYSRAPEIVVNAIVQRIRSGESMATASMFHIDALAKLAPLQFLEYRWEDLCHGWTPDSRCALADSLVVALEESRSQGEARAIALARRLMLDGTFAVRRSAARALGTINAAELHNQCDEWIRSGSIILRKRAAEAAAWLPPDRTDSLDNAYLRSLKLDPERQVRHAAKRSREELRRRIWALQHFNAVKSGDPANPNSWVFRHYSSGMALAKIGDDGILRQLTDEIRRPGLPPGVRHWFTQIRKKLEHSWQDVTRKWPDPWIPWEGAIEHLQGIVTIEGRPYRAEITLWLHPPKHDDDSIDWGGAARLGDPHIGFKMMLAPNDRYLVLEIDERDPVKVMIVGSHGAEVVLSGSGEYPSAKR